MSHFLLGMCSWLLRTSVVFQPMLWPIIDPIFVRFWARPEWIGSRLLNIKIRLQLFYNESCS